MFYAYAGFEPSTSVTTAVNTLDYLKSEFILYITYGEKRKFLNLDSTFEILKLY